MTVKVINGLHDGKRRAYSGRELSWNFRHAPLSARCLHPHADRHRDPGQRVSRQGASFMLVASNVAISLLFFLHGARLSTDAIVAGVKDLRLHALILGCTFVLFLLGLGRALFPLLTPGWLGVLFVCTLSSGAVVHRLHVHGARQRARRHLRATASNLLGTVLTPLLVAVLLHRQGGGHGLADAGRILLQLLLPFALRPCCGPGSAPGPSATAACCPRWTEARSCWPSTPPSAKRWRRASGTPFRRWTWPPWCWSTRYCWARCC